MSDNTELGRKRKLMDGGAVDSKRRKFESKADKKARKARKAEKNEQRSQNALAGLDTQVEGKDDQVMQEAGHVGSSKSDAEENGLQKSPKRKDEKKKKKGSKHSGDREQGRDEPRSTPVKQSDPLPSLEATTTPRIKDNNGFAAVQTETPPRSSKKRIKAERKHEKEARAAQLHVQVAAPSVTSFTPSGSSNGLEKVQAQDQELAVFSTWSSRHAVGGKFLDQRPLLTSDETYLVCATELAIHVYTTADSLLHQQLVTADDDSGSFTCYALSEVDPALVYAATSKGQVAAWNLSTGALLHTWNLKKSFQQMSVCKDGGTAGQEAIFTVSQADQTWAIDRCWLAGGQLKHNQIISYRSPIQRIQVLEGGVLVTITAETLMAGRPVQGDSSHKYKFAELKTSEAPTCFTARFSTRNGKKYLDVAVGGVKGSILYYQDLLHQLGLVGDAQRATNPPKTSQELHWHREAVGGIAFSLDGNYLISGGRETVLMLWNLDTSRTQHLPHLQSSIQSITVSPTGASYAVRLSDNSVMVLSTAELKPTANIASLQTPSLTAVPQFQPELPTVEVWQQLTNPSTEPLRVPATLCPQRSNELIVAVPSSLKDSAVAAFHASAPFLQTFDMTTSRQISRQALTRLNDTSSNIGPEGNRIVDPDVKHVESSANGKWLATVDEWSPHPNDLEDMCADPSDRPVAVEAHRSSQLRFWQYNDDLQLWALNSRIEMPHQLDESVVPGRVLDLVSSPDRSCFASIGQDAKIRIWEPKTVFNNGKVIRGETRKGKSKTTWTLRREIPIQKGMTSDPVQQVLPVRAKLAFSNDGSTIAATQHFDEAGQYRPRTFVHFVDPETDALRASRADLFNDEDGIHALGFLGSDLILAGRHEAIVWNVASMEKRATLKYPTKTRALPTLPPPLLAINPATSTFAVASSTPSNSLYTNTPLRAFTSRLEVFQLSDQGKVSTLLSDELPRLALALLSAGGAGQSLADDDDISTAGQGYIVVDAGAAVRTVRPGGWSRPHEAMQLDTAVPTTGTEDVEMVDVAAGQVEEMDEDEDQEEDGAQMTIENEAADYPVVRPEQLAGVFDHPTHAMPSVKDLFAGVLKLYAPRTPGVQAH